MKIAIIGATGFVGNAVVTEAKNRGHEITAIARDTTKIDVLDHLHVANVDVNDVENLKSVIQNHDIVINAFNPGATNPNLYDEFLKGSRNIQKAVKETHKSRLLVVGGAGSLFADEHGTQIVDTPQFPPPYKPVAVAARDYLNELKVVQDMEWTYICPAIQMSAENSGTRTGNYRIGKDFPVVDDDGISEISVEDLAVAIIDEAEHNKHHQSRFTVGY